MSLTSHQKKILLVVALVIVSIIFFGVKFYKRTPSPVTLEFWGISDESEIFLPLINNFQKQYPFLRINYTLKDRSTYHEDLLKSFADNQAPDMFMVWDNWLPYYETKISPLNLKTDKDLNLLDLEQTYPPIVKKGLLEDEYLLGIPLFIDQLVLYYNQDVFNYYNVALPPDTWEKILDLTPLLRRTNQLGQITRAAIALGSPYNVEWNFDIVSALMMQSGSDIVDANRKRTTFNYDILFNNKRIIPGEEALKFYTQFSNPYSRYYTWNDNFTNSVIAFSRGETVMMIGYHQAQSIIKSYAPNFNYGIASLPQFADSPSKINYGRVMTLVVSKSSKHPQECWKFLKYLSEKDKAQFYFLQTKNPPARLDLIQNYLNEPAAGVFIRQILTSQNWYQYNFQEIKQIFQEMMESVTLKGKTFTEAVITAAERINFFWSKR